MTLSQDPPVRQKASQATPHSAVPLVEGAPIGLPPLGADHEPIQIKGYDCLIKQQVPLSGLTSFRVGGPAEFYVTPRTLDELYASFDWGDRHAVPITLLGAGSNLLVSDAGVPGLIISTRYLRHLEFHDDGRITAGPGYPWQSWPGRQPIGAGRGWSGPWAFPVASVDRW